MLGEINNVRRLYNGIYGDEYTGDR